MPDGHAEVARTIKEYKAGKVEFRNDAGGIIHAVCGKMSFEEQKLVENIQAFIDQIQHLKPNTVKGQYVKSITIKGTMTIGIPVAA